MIIQIGELIGLWPTLALLLADALLGSLLLRHQGRGAWRRFNEAIARAALPRQGGRRRPPDRDRRHPAADPRLPHRHRRRDLPDPADPGARPAPAARLGRRALRRHGRPGGRGLRRRERREPRLRLRRGPEPARTAPAATTTSRGPPRRSTATTRSCPRQPGPAVLRAARLFNDGQLAGIRSSCRRATLAFSP